MENLEAQLQVGDSEMQSEDLGAAIENSNKEAEELHLVEKEEDKQLGQAMVESLQSEEDRKAMGDS